MLLEPLLAALPILGILLLMAGFRWGAARAGPVGWFLAIAVASVRFGAGIRLLALAQVKALLLSLDVLLIVWAAFLLYRVADEAGAIQAISRTLPELIQDRTLQALLIGWPFASFLQGVGGFGVPTAVTAPLLVGLGFTPLAAVVVPSLGHAWSVSFGSLGSSFQALMAASGLPGEVLAAPAAIVLGVLGFGCGAMAAHAAGGWSAARGTAGYVLMVGTAMGAVQLALAVNRLWNLAGFGAGLVGLVFGVLLARPTGRVPRSLLLATSGYAALIVITFSVQLIPPLREFLGQVELRTQFPALTTALGYSTPAGPGRTIAPFVHAGALLTYASIVAYLIYRAAGLYADGSLRRVLSGTASRMLPSSLGIASLVAMAVVMAHAGMTEIIAHGLARAAGPGYSLAAAWIGALGAFITGSNTNSNVVFTLLQLRTAELLRLNVPLLLAAQTAGGAIGSVFAPSKVIVGASTAGLAGQEGPVLRRLLGYCALLLAGLSLAIWFVIG